MPSLQIYEMFQTFDVMQVLCSKGGKTFEHAPQRLQGKVPCL